LPDRILQLNSPLREVPHPYEPNRLPLAHR
jgi:hypothetical protein